MIKLGLDIGTYSVKAIQLEKKERKILGFGIVEIQDGNIKEAILKATEQANLKTKRVNISVSGPQVITRYIPFPKLEIKEFKNSLRFEAAKHIPFSIEDVFLDGVILKEIEPDQMLTLIVAAKKEFIYSKIELLKDCSLQPEIIDVDSLCLFNLFNLLGESKERVVSILNIGSVYSNLIICENKTPVFSRDILIGSKLFTDRISEKFSVDFSEAQKIKHSPQDTKEIIKILETEISNLVFEVRASFDYYESRSGFSVEKIYFCGGGSLLEGLSDSISSLLGIEIGFWEPLKGLEIDKSLDLERLSNLSKQFSVALGLALR